MKTITYNKLVRDRIPEIIKAGGNECVTEVLTDEAYLSMLDKKLSEELAEYHADGNPEELTDLLEVIYAVARARGIAAEELDKIRAEKAQNRGSFDQKILLVSVEEKD